ncbi:MAG: chromosome segregation protein SMC, partial [Planctomycetota bacterium]|nr:chromosome segregation protein SMC [Planctomycetota bacterium]
TEFQFDTGLTCVVGPNGCGKSNIIDAIKWVMGEQRVKSLRGSAMTDVIFSGTTHRKPHGYAEASLIFSNTKNILDIDYDQVRVTRRLYRTGESEYFLNKAKCRLRDLKELFMGTGVGNNAYSVIEQGKIDVLLQANPQERRIIFEEAAGISKYKAKKKTALNKLNRVETNLVRLSDIINEVQRNMKSLQRQAGKARRYREYSRQLTELKSRYFLHRYHVLTSEFDLLDAQVKDGEANVGKKQAELEIMEADTERLGIEAIRVEQSLREKQSLRTEVEGRIQNTENEIQRATDRLRELEDSRQKFSQEISATSTRLQEAKAELIKAIDELEQAESEIKQRTLALEENQAQSRDLNERASNISHQVNELRQRHIDLMNERTRHSNELASLESQYKGIEAQVKRLLGRREQVQQELAELKMQRRELEQAISDLQSQLEEKQTRLGEVNTEVGDLEESLAGLDERLAAQRDNLTSNESRSETLQALERRREGMGTGVKQVLNAVQQDQLAGIVGTVAELLEVDVEHALAIESALATAAQTIVTSGTEESRAAIEYLRKDDRGRATFFPMDRVFGNGNGHPPVINNPNYLGRAKDFVRAKEEHLPLIGQLLAGTHVVRDFETALELAPMFSPTSRLVTLEGDVIGSSGPITGGGKVDRLGIISRKSELRMLDKQIGEIRLLMEQLSGERTQTNDRLNVLRQERETTQAAITDLTMSISENNTNLETAVRDSQDLEQEEQVLASELEDYRKQLERSEQEAKNLFRLIEEVDDKEEQVKVDQESLTVEMKGIEAQREGLREAFTHMNAELASLRQKIAGLKDNTTRNRRSIQENKDLLISRHEEIEQCGNRQDETRELIRSSETTLQSLFRELEVHDVAVREEENKLNEIRQEQDNNNINLRQAGHDLRTLEEQTNKLRLNRSEAEIRREKLLEQSQSELGLDLVEVYKQSDPEESEEDWNAIRDDVKVLENRIRNLGNVYEDAIEEYEKEELRYQTLTSQEADLLEAKKKLQEIIRKINRTSRRLFEAMFTTVRSNFQELFTKLFGGGKADIFLEEGVDILEAGIEIVARPPGKSENTVLSLLSGGEKALCTVALLFAIFKAKPSPFCILDEVDAPLDESNIDRYVSLVQEFNAKTQFIIVTHNRRTMRSADVIYGVTMQEPGVSSKISVRFEDYDQYVDRE